MRHAQKYLNHEDEMVRMEASVDDCTLLVDDSSLLVSLVEATQFILLEANLVTYKYASNCKEALEPFADKALPDAK